VFNAWTFDDFIPVLYYSRQRFELIYANKRIESINNLNINRTVRFEDASPGVRTEVFPVWNFSRFRYLPIKWHKTKRTINDEFLLRFVRYIFSLSLLRNILGGLGCLKIRSTAHVGVWSIINYSFAHGTIENVSQRMGPKDVYCVYDSPYERKREIKDETFSLAK